MCQCQSGSSPAHSWYRPQQSAQYAHAHARQPTGRQYVAQPSTCYQRFMHTLLGEPIMQTHAWCSACMLCTFEGPCLIIISALSQAVTDSCYGLAGAALSVCLVLVSCQVVARAKRFSMQTVLSTVVEQGLFILKLSCVPSNGRLQQQAMILSQQMACMLQHVIDRSPSLPGSVRLIQGR